MPVRTALHETNGHHVTATPRRKSGPLTVDSADEVDQPSAPVSTVANRLADQLRAKRQQADELGKGKHAKLEPDTIYTAAEIMAMHLPDPQCVVHEVVTEGLNLLVSRPKLGKSWLALQIAIAVAMGWFALGSKSTEQGDVLYLALEDSYRRLQDRLRKLLRGKEPPKRLEITNAWAPLDKGGTEEIIKWAKGVKRPQLVVIDTVERVRSATTRRGNAYSDDYSYLAGVHEILKTTNISSILGLHHDRKADSLDPLDVVSGSIGMTAAVDAILLLKRERGKADGYLKVHSRDMDEQDYGLQWSKEQCGWTLVGSGAELRMSGQRLEVFECVKQHGPLTLEDVVEHLGKKERKNNIKQFLCQLVKKGELVNTDGQYAVPH